MMWMKLVLTCSQNMMAFGLCQKDTKICKYHIILEILVIFSKHYPSKKNNNNNNKKNKIRNKKLAGVKKNCFYLIENQNTQLKEIG